LPAVAFDLGFTGAAEEAEAAALALEVGPGPDQPALLVVEVGQFDLEHALAGGSALAEDFEDQRCAVEHLGAGFLLEIALLDRRKRGVDDQQIDIIFLHPAGKVLDVAAADEGGGFDLAYLDDLGEDDLEIDGARQALELGLACLDTVEARLAPHFRHDQPDPRRRGALIDKGLRAALADGIVIGLFSHGRRQSSAACSGSKSWIGAPGIMVDIACL
jgi:hypothetical protein